MRTPEGGRNVGRGLAKGELPSHRRPSKVKRELPEGIVSESSKRTLSRRDISIETFC